MGKKQTRKQAEFQAMVNKTLKRKKNYKHQRKHNGIPNLGVLHPNFGKENSNA